MALITKYGPALLSVAMALLLAVPGRGAADDVIRDLYTAEIAVPDQSEQTRARALAEAFDRVLVKLSGQRSLEEVPGLDELRAQAAGWLQSVLFETVPVPGEGGADREQLFMVARFDEDMMDQSLKRLQLPRWPRQRTSLQLYLALDDGMQRRFLSAGDRELRHAVERIAAQRGLPLSAFTAEQENQASDVSLQEIWGGFTETPLFVSRSQGFAGVLLAAAYGSNDAWQVRWNMTDGERYWNWQTLGEDLQTAVAEGIHAGADNIAAASSIHAGAQGDWRESIEVANLTGAEDYFRCLNYLENLDLVNAVRIEKLEGDRVRFRLQLNAAPEYLYSTVAAGGVLEPVGSALSGGARLFEMLQ